MVDLRDEFGGQHISLFWFFTYGIKAFWCILKNKHAIQNIFSSFTFHSKTRPERLPHAMSSSVIHEHLLLVREVRLENALTVAGSGSDIWKVAIFLLNLSQGSSTSIGVNFPSGSWFSWPFVCVCVCIQRHSILIISSSIGFYFLLAVSLFF